ncbi:MAG: hypothetical protein AAF281_07965 [Pseudomonadota bacterium]
MLTSGMLKAMVIALLTTSAAAAEDRFPVFGASDARAAFFAAQSAARAEAGKAEAARKDTAVARVQDESPRPAARITRRRPPDPIVCRTAPAPRPGRNATPPPTLPTPGTRADRAAPERVCHSVPPAPPIIVVRDPIVLRPALRIIFRID